MGRKVLISFEIDENSFLKKVNLSNNEYLKIKKKLNITEDFNIEVAEKIANYIDVELDIILTTEEQLTQYLKYNTNVAKTPRITIVGHVNHGKTTLVDYLMKTNVVYKEAGGITQTISLHKLKYHDKEFILIDTPGHSIFKSLRKFVIDLSDIVILIVAANEGVKEQTIEIAQMIINKPTIICLNKIDKASDNLDKIFTDLCSYGCVAEEYGGECLTSRISAKDGLGVDKLLENISLLSEHLELTTNLERPGIGTIVDVHLQKGMGLVVKVLLQAGQIKLKDSFLCLSKVNFINQLKRLMVLGKICTHANANDIIDVLGMDERPNIGDKIIFGEENKLKVFLSADMNAKSKNSGSKISNYNFIVKTTQGCQLETLIDTMNKYGIVVDGGIGEPTEMEIETAYKSGLIFILWGNFNDATIKKLKEKKIQFFASNIVYEITESLEEFIADKEKVTEYEEIGKAEIKKIFDFSGKKIAGCKVISGLISIGDKVFIKRGEEKIMMCTVVSMKREKDTIKEAKKDSECGLLLDTLERYAETPEFKEGDFVISVKEID